RPFSGAPGEPAKLHVYRVFCVDVTHDGLRDIVVSFDQVGTAGYGPWALVRQTQSGWIFGDWRNEDAYRLGVTANGEITNSWQTKLPGDARWPTGPIEHRIYRWNGRVL